MKTLLGLIALSVCISIVLAADRENANQIVERGFYIRPVVKFSSLDGTAQLWKGGQVGGMISDHIGLGMAYFGRSGFYDSRSYYNEDFLPQPNYVWSYAYAGPVVTFAHKLSRVWRLSADLLIADGWYNRERDPLSEENHTIHRDRFGVVEPSVWIEAQMIPHVHVTTGLGYIVSFGDGRFYRDSPLDNMVVSTGIKVSTW